MAPVPVSGAGVGSALDCLVDAELRGARADDVAAQFDGRREFEVKSCETLVARRSRVRVSLPET